MWRCGTSPLWRCASQLLSSSSSTTAASSLFSASSSSVFSSRKWGNTSRGIHSSSCDVPTQSTTGLLTLEQLEKKVQSGEIHTVCVMAPDQFGRLMGKRFDAEWFVKSVHSHGSHFCTYLLTADINLVPQSGFEYSSWESGYGDFHVAPDCDTLRQCAWLPGSALVLCDITTETDYVAVAPRSILRKQINAAKEMGLSPMTVAELEYYIFTDSYRQAFEKDYRNLQPRGYYVEDYHMLQGSRNEDLNLEARRCLKASGIPVESTKGEAGVGQHELNLRYSDALTAADHAVLYKHCFKELADQKNISVTFMAKPSEKDSGSSCHIHMSLWRDGRNIFEGDRPLTKRIHTSDEFRWFLGGWIKHMPDLMLMYAPTINSYKRYMKASWAPTSLGWSVDNRTAGFRIVGHNQSLRVENRIPGADCNPYLAFAASIASGLDGIRNKIEPPAMGDGNAYAAEEGKSVPLSLESAKDLFRASEFAKETFGRDVVDHYARHAEVEIESFNKSVTDWERRRYFEQI